MIIIIEYPTKAKNFKNFMKTQLEKVTRFTGFAGGKVIKAIHLTFRLQSSSL